MAGLIALLLAAVVLVECRRIVIGFRRAVRLNRAMHELRRPLQGLSLSIEGHSADLEGAGACLDQALGALDDLDAAINRRPSAPRVVRTALAEIAGTLEERWRFAGVQVAPVDGSTALSVDPLRIGAALDNLVSNAVEHGSRPISVRALPARGSVRFEVRDGGPAAEARPGPSDPRRGHGLSIAGEVVAVHGGTVIPPRRIAGGETLAALSLPVSPPGAGPG